MSEISRPINSKRYRVLDTTTDDGINKGVAVPSRLYSLPSLGLSSNGMRVSIKDNISLTGVKSTNMDRYFAELYPPAVSTSLYVEKLINLGAVIVGTTKMSSFATAEEATDQ